MKSYLWTKSGCRLQQQSAAEGDAIHWLFLPGGPGLGSEALVDLTQTLKNRIPGVIWHVDLPNDGSNLVNKKILDEWKPALLEAVKAFDQVILVAHSSLSMYVQTVPELETILQGLVLLSSAPDTAWQIQFAEYCEAHPHSLINAAQQKYIDSPSNENLRTLLIHSAQYCFNTERTIEAGKALLRQLPINYAANEWSAQHFDSAYQTKWVPQALPTLIATGSEDHITPLSFFKNNSNYHRDNILIREISDAGHYPWFENPEAIVDAFQEFYRKWRGLI